MHDAESYKSPPSVHSQLLAELSRLKNDEYVATFIAEDGAPEQRVEHKLGDEVYSIHYTSTAEHPDKPTTRMVVDSKQGSQILLIDDEMQLSELKPGPILSRIGDDSKLDLLQRLRQLGQETQIATTGTLQRLADAIAERCEPQELKLTKDGSTKQTQLREFAAENDNPSSIMLERREELEGTRQTRLSLTAYWIESDAATYFTLQPHLSRLGEFTVGCSYVPNVGASPNDRLGTVRHTLMEQEVQQALSWIDNSEEVDMPTIDT